MTALGLFTPSGNGQEFQTTVTALAINVKGMIVGEVGTHTPIGMSGLPNSGGFIWQDKKLVGGVGSILYSINNTGEVVGLEDFRGLYGTNPIILNTISHRPAGNGSIAMAINDKGQFVGATTVDVHNASDPPLHAFLWVGSKKHGRMKDLGALPNYPYSIATAINNRGQVVGFAGVGGWGRLCMVQGTTHAFLWCKDRMADLGLLPDTNSSQANGINNNGQIVGMSGGRAVLWCGGKAYDLNTLIEVPVSPPLREATGINNLGQIICNNGSGSFLLTPIK